jgi:hypothetical protein
MAQQVNVKFVDDLDGSDAAGTVSFAIDGRAYEIDLSKDNAARLRLARSRSGAQTRPDGTLVIGALTIEQDTYSAQLPDRHLDLTYKEFELLKYLAQRATPTRQARHRTPTDDHHNAQRRLQTCPTPTRRSAPATAPSHHRS